MLHQVKEALRVKMAGNVYVTLIHEATNEDPWGPTGQQMDEVTRNFHSGHEEIMEELVLRLKQRNHSWRSCYKSLLVIDHLARNVHESLLPVISVLVPTLKQISQSFTCNEKGVDRGLSVRERSRKLAELLTNGELLQDEREKAAATRRKVTGGPLSVGSADVPAPAGRGHSSSYDVYDTAAPPSHQFRNSAVATTGGRATNLREEQERRDMELAARLQNEEERRANARGETIPYLHEEPVRVGRVKAAAPQQQQPVASSSPSARHPGLNTQGLTQDEIDERIAIEMQRRLDAGEPLTPTLFQQQQAPSPISGKQQNTPSTSLFDEHSSNTSAPPRPAQQPAAPAPNTNIDSFFDFGASSAPQPTQQRNTVAPQQQQDVFDPFAAPPAQTAPAAAPVASETDFFDNFIAQRKDQNRQPPQQPVATTSRVTTSEDDMFASSNHQQHTASTSSADPFEQQMRGLQGIQGGANAARPTLEAVQSSRQPLW